MEDPALVTALKAIPEYYYTPSSLETGGNNGQGSRLQIDVETKLLGLHKKQLAALEVLKTVGFTALFLLVISSALRRARVNKGPGWIAG